MGIPTLADRIRERAEQRDAELRNRVIAPPRTEAEWVRRAREKRLPTRIEYGGNEAA